MRDPIGQLRPKSTAGVVMSGLVALVTFMILAAEAPEVLFAAVVVVPLIWFLAQSGEFGDLDDGVFDALEDDESAFESDETALDRLRRRYADGDLSDEEFERRLDRLLETETLEDAKRDRNRTTDSSRERERER
ncbi:SHOCT domain-containing protein [Halorussus amylolyticus]|uniref:SHOCT domain-containing protein n=1 Tax=Halorussus amylolyticus TaxID=1126242 RepID=UPI00138F5EBE|nr:SHOCT domain-containing protein [Halorussus amylolyticus]